jgi:hypothetical protein
MEVELNEFLAAAVEERSFVFHFLNSSEYSMGCWMGLRDSLDVARDRKINLHVGTNCQ